MIRPTPDDVGRAVVYKATGSLDPVEEGVITSYNEQFVFVRYDRDLGSKATRREDLVWSVASRRMFP